MKIRWLLRLYPRAWRERYGREVESLLERTPVTWRTRVDLIIGAGSEWAYPLGWCTSRRLLRTTGVAWVVGPWLGGILIRQAGHLIGVTLAHAGANVPSGALLVAAAVGVFAFARGAVGVWASSRVALNGERTAYLRLLVGPRELGTWLALLLAATVTTSMVLEARTPGHAPIGSWWGLSPLMLLALGSLRATRLGRLAILLARRDRRIKIRRQLAPFLGL